MLKFFTIIFTIIFLSINGSSADYKVGQEVTKKFEMSRNFKIGLPPGKWIVTQKNSDYYYGLRFKSMILIRLENNK